MNYMVIEMAKSIFGEPVPTVALNFCYWLT